MHRTSRIRAATVMAAALLLIAATALACGGAAYTPAPGGPAAAGAPAPASGSTTERTASTARRIAATRTATVDDGATAAGGASARSSAGATAAPAGGPVEMVKEAETASSGAGSTATPAAMAATMAPAAVAMSAAGTTATPATAMMAAGAQGAQGAPGSIPPEAGGTENPNDAPYPLTYYEHYGVNPFIDADEDPLSTFALDGDTASYEILKQYLRDGYLVDPDAVRVEDTSTACPRGTRRRTRRWGCTWTPDRRRLPMRAMRCCGWASATRRRAWTGSRYR